MQPLRGHLTSSPQVARPITSAIMTHFRATGRTIVTPGATPAFGFPYAASSEVLIDSRSGNSFTRLRSELLSCWIKCLQTTDMSDEPASQSSEPSNVEPVLIAERDIVFNCPHCSGELVVDRDGAGMTFECSHCNGEVVVPPYVGPSPALRTPPPAPVPAEAEDVLATQKARDSAGVSGPLKSAEEIAATFDFSEETTEALRERLKVLKLQHQENASQRTEMRGHINRAQIELHRMQLKLQRLIDRQAEIEGEATSAQKAIKEKSAPAPGS